MVVQPSEVRRPRGGARRRRRRRGVIEKFRSFEQQKAKREKEIAELAGKMDTASDEEKAKIAEEMAEYERQVASLAKKITEANANAAARAGAPAPPPEPPAAAEPPPPEPEPEPPAAAEEPAAEPAAAEGGARPERGRVVAHQDGTRTYPAKTHVREPRRRECGLSD